MSEEQSGRVAFPVIATLRPVPSLAEGYEHLGRGDWAAATAYFRDAIALDRTPEAFEALGMTAWLAHDDATVFEAREAAYELYRVLNDALGAARMALWLAEDYLQFRGEPAVSNGWLRRAHSLLDPLEVTDEHAWLALVEADITPMVGSDAETSRAKAAEAVALARRVGSVDAEMYGLALEGLACVTMGAVREGMSKLDEAATACVAGDVKEVWLISSILCKMMDACHRVRDWERARQWFRQVELFAARWNSREFYALCRPNYAVLLTWRGAWQEAESELQLSIDDIRNTFAFPAVEAIVRLGELRWRQGRWREAEALFEQVGADPMAQLGRAALALDQGHHERALELVDRCLRRLPAADRLERLPALELQLRACLAGGDCEAAKAILPDLQALAAVIGTTPVRAASELTAGLVAAADGDPSRARQHLEDAVDYFDASKAPFEAGRARLELARVLLQLGRRGDAAALASRAFDSLQRLGAQVEAERASRLLAVATAPEAADLTSDTLAGLSRREVEVLRLLAGGLSNQEIADRLVLSVRTVQRHVENIYAKTGAHGRAAAAVFAAAHNLVA
jgi:DNA-binding NarL/FixJ family response regulator